MWTACAAGGVNETATLADGSVNTLHGRCTRPCESAAVVDGDTCVGRCVCDGDSTLHMGRCQQTTALVQALRARADAVAQEEQAAAELAQLEFRIANGSNETLPGGGGPKFGVDLDQVNSA